MGGIGLEPTTSTMSTWRSKPTELTARKLPFHLLTLDRARTQIGKFEVKIIANRNLVSIGQFGQKIKPICHAFRTSFIDETLIRPEDGALTDSSKFTPFRFFHQSYGKRLFLDLEVRHFFRKRPDPRSAPHPGTKSTGEPTFSFGVISSILRYRFLVTLF